MFTYWHRAIVIISKLLVALVTYLPYINYLFVNRTLFISGYIIAEKLIQFSRTYH